MHWAQCYLGKPWRDGADGPDAFGCWGLLRAVYRDQLGIELPAVEIDGLSTAQCVRAIDDGAEARNWRPIETPTDLCAVKLSRAKHPHHVGLWIDIDGGGVLHSLSGAGVIFESAEKLRAWRWNIQGFYVRA